MRNEAACRRPIRALVAILMVMSLSSCAALSQLGLDLNKYRPTVSFEGLSVRGIDWNKVDLDFKFRINNPNPLNVKMDSFSWALDLAGKRALDGTNTSGIALKANGSSNFSLPVSLTFQRIFALAGALKGRDKVGFKLGGDFGFNTPIGTIRVPYVKTGDVPVLHKPRFSLAGLRAGKMNLLGGTATVFIDVKVANDGGGSSIAVNAFDYAVKIAGRAAVSGMVNNLANVTAGQVKTVSLPVNLNLASIGMTAVAALTGKGRLPVALDAKMLVTTPFGNVPLKIADGRQLTVL